MRIVSITALSPALGLAAAVPAAAGLGPRVSSFFFNARGLVMLSCSILVRAAGFAVLIVAAAAAAGAQEKVRIAGNPPADHSTSIAMERVFKKELVRLSNGKLDVDVFLPLNSLRATPCQGCAGDRN